MAHFEDHKIAECRIYTAGWGFVTVSATIMVLGLISMAPEVPAAPIYICAGIVAVVGYPCVVLAAWGDRVNNVIDSILNLFKRKEKE